MSSLVFPSLPALNVAVTRTPRYATHIHESVSGREVRTSWRTAKRVRFGLRFNGVRTGTAAPSPYQAASESQVLLDFLDQHRGAWGDFLFVDPHPPHTEYRVRFVEDSLEMVQVVPGLWAVSSLELESVL